MTLTLEHDYIGIGLSLPDSDSDSDTDGSSSGSSSSTVVSSDSDLKTELRLGLPGSESPPALTLSISVAAATPRGSKRGFSGAIVDNPNKWTFPNKPGSDPEPASNNPEEDDDDMKKKNLEANAAPASPAAKKQVVGWPPIRSYRKNTMATNSNANPSRKKEDSAEAKQGPGCLYVKVSMDGAPYLRKVDLRMCSNYKELSLALEKMFSCFTIGQCGSHGIPARDGQSENKLTDHGSENVLTYEDKDGDWMLVGDVPWDMFTETCKRLRIMKASDAIGLAPRAGGKIKNRK